MNCNREGKSHIRPGCVKWICLILWFDGLIPRSKRQRCFKVLASVFTSQCSQLKVHSLLALNQEGYIIIAKMKFKLLSLTRRWTIRERRTDCWENSPLIILLLIQLSLISVPYSVPKSSYQNIPRNKSSVSIVLLGKAKLRVFIKKLYLFVISGSKLTNLSKE